MTDISQPMHIHERIALGVALFGLTLLSGCGQTERNTISIEGPTLFYRSGAVQLIDLTGGRSTFDFMASPALEELTVKGIFAGVPEDCLVVVYGVRVEGRLAKERSIYATNGSIVRRYTRGQLDDELTNIGIEALEDTQVCPSA